MSRTRLTLSAAIAGVILVFVLTMRRVPTPFPDSQLYASIAYSVEAYGVGVPSVNLKSPVAVDHVDFYGPVFFRLVAFAYDRFGVNLRSVRLVSLAGALLIAGAGAWLAYDLTGSGDRALWAALLLLVAPDVRGEATSGTMATLAVGFSILALAAHLRAQRGGPCARWTAIGAGAALALAALTTPRTYPFAFGFFAAAVYSARRHLALVAVTFAACVAAWAIASHDSVAAWARYIAFILTHEDSDVAVLPGAVRAWAFHWNATVVPAFAAAGALVAARRLSRGAGAEVRGRAGFAILAGWIAFVATVAGMNLTFTVGPYLAVPLFATVLALPWERLRLPRRTIVAATCALVACESVTYAVAYARVAVTWSARDRDAVIAFFRAHVPPRAMVVGAEAPYFLAVKSAGASYRTVSPASWADWARWVPTIEPDAVTDDDDIAVPAPRARFLVWDAYDELPAGYACARGHLVDVFVPASRHLDLLGPLARTADAGYSPAALYRLPPGCPTGYDPTASDPSMKHEGGDRAGN